MTTLRIAEVAERTRIPATTLRYYEEIGLLAPAPRSDNGYRAYSERDVERLAFITRAKQLDLSLDDLRELVEAWDDEDCGEVQQRMAGVVDARLREARNRVVALVELTAQLQAAAARLNGPAHPGACDDGCVCSTATATPTAVRLAGSGTPPIACTLPAAEVRGRMDDWQEVLARATSRRPAPGGTALTFPTDPDLVADLARLAAAEHACCSFFSFTITVTGTGTELVVRAPEEAGDVVSAVFGAPDPDSQDHRLSPHNWPPRAPSAGTAGDLR